MARRNEENHYQLLSMREYPYNPHTHTLYTLRQEKPDVLP